MSLRAGSETHLPDLSHMNFDLQQPSVTKSGPVNTSKVQFIHRQQKRMKKLWDEEGMP